MRVDEEAKWPTGLSLNLTMPSVRWLSSTALANVVLHIPFVFVGNLVRPKLSHTDSAKRDYIQAT